MRMVAMTGDGNRPMSSCLRIMSTGRLWH